MDVVINKITQYYAKNEIENQREKETAVEIVKEFLLNKNSSDMFSGVGATRGFFYQYLLFVYYCLECIENDNYEEVWYEVGDDITLVGNNCLDFIQVKTEKATVIDGRINTTDMTERSNGFDSWIDKLFLQYEELKSAINKDISNVSIKFKLCSNKRLAPGLHISSINNKYQNTLNINKVKKAIEKKQIFKVKNDKNKDIEIECELKEELSNKIDWYFERAIFESFGDRSTLEATISEKIEKIFNESSKDLSVYCTKRFLVDALYLTSDDSDTSQEQRKKFCFKKSIIKSTFESLINNYKKETYDKLKGEMIEENFNQIFIEIQEEIISSYKDKILNVMIEKLNWLANELKQTASSNDKYVYERFVNRIFVLENGSQALVDFIRDKHYIKRTLTILIYLLSVYNNHKIGLEKEIKMLIHSCWDEENNDIVIITNGRGKMYECDVKNDIDLKSVKCKFLNKYSSDIDCVLIDFKQNKKSKSKFSKNYMINEYERSNEEIKAIETKINFVHSETIECLFDEISNTIQNQDVYNDIVQNRRGYIYEEV